LDSPGISFSRLAVVEVLTCTNRKGVVGSQAGLTDSQGALGQEAGSGQVAVGTQDFAEVVQAAGV
jgi:hypothetical protein